MSWFSFAVPPLVVPGRVVLCVTTILTLTSMFSTARTSTPQVSYIKALDVFMITSIIFVFLTLLEYTFLLRKRRLHLLEAAIKERTSNRRRWMNRKGESYEEYCARIDRRAVIIMPALFVAFNLVYWPYYAGQRN
ncbi:glycine receptor subunit alphaZ1-like [Penaeus chinensis]|uniref:glycine receptor subunit alphaZ1-like n=1 Tax=Penaeus chinensis TaxID=139456 RepID=UPI001FB85FBD|nr:glycine receptor subunit alphaZ1-like [Penaeus chinensis]